MRQHQTLSMKYSQPSVICTAIEQCGTCNYGSSIMIM